MKLSMRKYLTAILLAIMVITCSVGMPLDARAETSGNITWKIDGETLTISGTGDMPKYEEYEQPWADSAFDITKVIIGEGITSISRNAFYGANNLVTVQLPSTLKRIDEYAFGCTNITEIKLNEGLTTLGNQAFTSTPLTKIHIPASVSSANWPWVFSSCDEMEELTIASGNKKYTTSGKAILTKDKKELLYCIQKNGLTGYEIPSSVEKISDSAFRNNYSLKKINLHENIKTIGHGAFLGCNALEEVVIPNSVTTLGKDIFMQSENIKKATIGKGVTTLTEGLFSACSNLEEVQILGKVKDIDMCAFSGCSKLKTIVLPDTVEHIGSAAFRDCEALQSLSISSAMKYIEASAFEGCTNLKLNVPSTLLQLEDDSYVRASVVKVEAKQRYDMAFQVMEKVNKERKAKGLSSLAMDQGLLEHAMQRAAECYIRLDHRNPLGQKDFGDARGENLAFDYSVDGVMDAWMNSSGHRANILGTDWKAIGVGCFEKDGAFYFIQLFGDELKSTATKPSNNTKIRSVNIMDGDFEISLSTEGENRKYSKGKTFTITAYSRDINPEYTHWIPAELHPSTFTWKSGDTGVVNVDQTGKCTAVGVGKTTITATIKQGVKKSFTMNIEVTGSSELTTPVVSKTNDSATGKPKLTWKKVPGAAKYEIYRYDSTSNSYIKMISTTGTAFTNTSAVAGKTYYYKVKAISSSSSIKSSITGAISITCKYPAPKITGTNDSATGKCKLTWKKVDGATKYEIYRYDSEKKTYVKMHTTTGTSYTNTTTVAGKTYRYKVKAVGSVSAATSAFSSYAEITCKYPAPKITGTNDASTGKCKLTWQKVDGATKYEIYRYDSEKKTYVKMHTTSNTSYTNTTAVAGYTYWYRVKAVGSMSTATSAFSSYAEITCKYATPKVTGSNDPNTGKCKLTWNKVDGATKYEIYRYDSAKKAYVKMHTTTNTVYTNTTAVAGKTYYYKVRAIGRKDAAASNYSDSVKVTCK